MAVDLVGSGSDPERSRSDQGFPLGDQAQLLRTKKKNKYVYENTESLFLLLTTVSMEMVSHSLSIQIVIFRHFTFTKCHTWRRSAFTALFWLLVPPQMQSPLLKKNPSRHWGRLLVDCPALLRLLFRFKSEHDVTLLQPNLMSPNHQKKRIRRLNVGRGAHKSETISRENEMKDLINED